MIAFVHIPKSAGKTVARILRRNFGMAHCNVFSWRNEPVFTAEDFKRLKRYYRKLKSISGHAVRPYSDLETVCPDVRYCAMFRSPVERCAAHFEYQVRHMGKEVSFEEWIGDPRYRNVQTQYLAERGGAVAAIDIIARKQIWVGLSARLAESALLLAAWTGKDGFDPCFPVYGKTSAWTSLSRVLTSDPLLRKSPPSEITRKLLDDDRSLKLLEDANREDQQVFDYVTNKVFPQQVTGYGPDFERDLARFVESNHFPAFSVNSQLSRLKGYLVYGPVRWLSQRF